MLDKFKPLFSDKPGLSNVGECKIEIVEGSGVVNKSHTGFTTLKGSSWQLSDSP